jgi:peptidoglycan glycosyltransferase
MSKRMAGQLTDLMIGVVTEGTGFAAAIDEAQVAGKTGTAELGPKPGTEEEEEPEQIKDAWFAAFAPAEKPRLAVGVLLIEAEAAGYSMNNRTVFQLVDFLTPRACRA